MDKTDLKQNILSVQLDFFIEENNKLKKEKEALLALIHKHFDTKLAAINMIDNALAETHGR